MSDQDTRIEDAIQEVSAKTQAARPKGPVWPRIDDPRNLALNPLRARQISRVFIDMGTGTILAYRTIRNLDVSLDVFDENAPFAQAIMAIAGEFGWQSAGLGVMHLRIMRLDAVKEIPAPADPAQFEYREPVPAWPEAEEVVATPEAVAPQDEAQDAAGLDDDLDAIEIDMAALDEELSGASQP